jgi:hypothetical protein
MMFSGLLPVGSVVLLKGGARKLMIAGVCQKQLNEEGTLWDYVGVLYPQGYMGADKLFMFNNDQIEVVHAIGYQDQEQFEFKIKADAMQKQMRGEEPAAT